MAAKPLTRGFKIGATNSIIARAVTFQEALYFLIQINITRARIDQDQRAASTQQHKLIGSHCQSLISWYSIQFSGTQQVSTGGKA